MKGGALKIGGAAGERLGGPLAGETEGMNGGLIHVGGSTGDRAADKMRRGLILVEGAAGDYVGSRMLAGTLAIGGRAGALPGYLMNRGSNPARRWGWRDVADIRRLRCICAGGGKGHRCSCGRDQRASRRRFARR